MAAALGRMALMGRKTRSPRRRTDKPAWLVVDQEFALRACKVVDISDEGARLDVEPGERLPRHFRLTYSRTSRDGRRCEMRWRRGRSVGVKFVA
jgi:hypothetical protein